MLLQKSVIVLSSHEAELVIKYHRHNISKNTEPHGVILSSYEILADWITAYFFLASF